jgi:transcriptional regulator with XRE-family HTH domain
MIDGKRLRKLREQLNLSPDELGQAVNVSRQQIGRYEANRTDVTSDTLVKFADFFDVTTDYLLGRSDVKHGYDRRGNRVTVELDRLIKLSPKAAAKLLLALKVQLEPNPVVIDLADLLTKLPPAYVAQFLDELGLEIKMTNTPASPNIPDS